MNIASLCSIPARKNDCIEIIKRVIFEQTTPPDYLNVWLDGYSEVPSEFPINRKIKYIINHEKRGPWIRYLSSQMLNCNDIFITLDDDIIYPNNYIENGLKLISSIKDSNVGCFSAINWDPFQDGFEYGRNRFQYMVEHALFKPQKVSLHKGQTGFFRAKVLQKCIDLSIRGFNTNDDMMVAFHLRKINEKIICWPKEKGWIKETRSSRSSVALYKKDAKVRRKVFSKIIRKGFDPTAGILNNYLSYQNRILVLTDQFLPFEVNSSIHEKLFELCDNSTSVHVIAPVLSKNEDFIQYEVNLPYSIHPVSIPELSGRFHNIKAVEIWRKNRINRGYFTNWKARESITTKFLKPLKVLDWRE